MRNIKTCIGLAVFIIVIFRTFGAIAQSDQIHNVATISRRADTAKNNDQVKPFWGSNKNTPPSSADEITTNKVKDGENGWRKIIFDPTAVFTGIIAIFTIGMFHIARDTARRQLRAYVSVTGGGADWNNMGDIAVTLTFKNCGQTPAYNVRNWATIKLVDFPFKSEIFNVKPGESEINSVMPPQGEIIKLMQRKEYITETDHRQLQRGSKALCIFGEIHYIDAFKRRHYSKFRFMQGGDVGFRGQHLSRCAGGNEES